MLSFYLVSTACYALLLLWMLWSWTESDSNDSARQSSGSASLIISCRNEAKNIPSMIEGVLSQLTELDEVIFVDDSSEDETLELLQKATADYSKLKVIQNSGSGKKAALSEAIHQATGEWIVTTDADCQWPVNWVNKIKSSFHDPKVQMVAGPVLPNAKNTTEKFELIDWASILLVTNFSFKRKSPLMCSAANLAFRKSAFEIVDGYQGNEKILSGDDEFLLKKIHKQFGVDAIKYLTSKSTLVFTKPQASLEALLNQRIRWGSKWRMHQGFSHSFSALGALLIQLFWISSFFLPFLGMKSFLSLLLIWGAKVGVERFVLGKILNFYGQKASCGDFVWASFFHPVFVLRVGIGAFNGKFEWKGRSTRRNSIFA